MKKEDKIRKISKFFAIFVTKFKLAIKVFPRCSMFVCFEFKKK